MKLNRLSERIWFLPFEKERDRPNLGYIRGDHWSLAVDAGHSRAHTEAFYRALEEAGLPLPSLTVLTHWHWDHTFGMHAVHGLCLAGERTDALLRDFRKRLAESGPGFFLDMDETIRREYAGGQPVTVVPADMVFTGEVRLDAGNCPIRLFPTESPHTDDSTLVEVPGESVLFLGDAASGVFPSWEKDPVLAARLASSVRSTGMQICLEGHWTPQSSDELIQDLLTPEKA